MSYQVDDDPPIKSHPASKEYLENYDKLDWSDDKPSDNTPVASSTRRQPRPVECSTCGAKDAAPCDDDIHEATGKPIER